LFWTGARRAEPLKADVDALGTELEMRVREASAGARARATTLSELPRLQLAVATDAATVRDLTTEELAFQPQTGETIEIGQLPRGRAPVSLIQLPRGSAFHAPLERTGSWLLPVSGQMAVCVVASVEPRARSEEVGGAVAVTWLIDTQAVAARLDQLGLAARIDMPAGTVALGTRALPDSGPRLAFSLGSESIGSAKLVAAAPGRLLAREVQAAGCLLALAALVAGMVIGRRGGRAAADSAGQGRSNPAGSAVSEPARLGGSAAAPPVALSAGPPLLAPWTRARAVSVPPNSGGPRPVPEALAKEARLGTFDEVTPDLRFPVDVVGNTAPAVNGAGPAPARTAAPPTPTQPPAPPLDRADFPVHVVSEPSGTVSPEPLPVVVDAHTARPPGGEEVVARYQGVFREFLELRRFCDEAADISFESFLGRLTAARVQLLQRGAYEDVTFDVFINGEGRAAVRAIGRAR